MAGGVTITDRDKGWTALKRVIKSLEQGSSYVKVGMVGEKAAKQEHAAQEQGGEPLTNVALMAIHEFGTEHVPERSVIRRVFDTKREEYVALLRRMVPGIYEGRATVKKVLDIVGFRMKFDMKAFIKQGEVTPPLADATMRQKRKRGSWNKGPTKDRDPIPLLDTGRLVGAIDHAVVIQSREQVASGETQVGSATLVREGP